MGQSMTAKLEVTAAFLERPGKGVNTSNYDILKCTCIYLRSASASKCLWSERKHVCKDQLVK